MSQLLLDISPGHNPTLENFVVGHNAELLTALSHALESSCDERCFYIWGESGSGKTHLLRACAFAASGGTGYVRGSVPESMAMVALDDVETLDAAGQIELFNLYNRMRDSGGLLVVSGAQSPLHLKLRDDLRTRLGWGLVYQLHSLSDEEKARALMQHAHERGLVLSSDVIQYLLRHGRRDLPSLMVVLDALDEHSLRLHRAPSVPLLKEILQQELELK
ncbi:MAG: DnaA regulatory inactivator Hda [Gallionella sp.]